MLSNVCVGVIVFCFGMQIENHAAQPEGPDERVFGFCFSQRFSDHCHATRVVTDDGSLHPRWIQPWILAI